MEITKDTPREKVIMQGEEVSLPILEKVGTPMTQEHVRSLQKLFFIDARNHVTRPLREQASVQAKEEGGSAAQIAERTLELLAQKMKEADLQTIVDTYAEGYTFGRKVIARSSDPLAPIMRQLAEAHAKKTLAEKGEDVSRENVRSFATLLLGDFEDRFRSAAGKVMAAREKAAAGLNIDA